jgi:hypothetical protein
MAYDSAEGFGVHEAPLRVKNKQPSQQQQYQ